jgi:hypothetical protein
MLAELEASLVVSVLFNFSHHSREQLEREVLDTD